MDKSLQLGIPTKKIVSQRWDMLSVRVLVNILFKSGKTKKPKNHHSNSNSVNLCHMVVDFYLEQCS